MRDLTKVIDKIVAVAPDLEQVLSVSRSNTLYTAPEAMYIRWREVAEILTEYAIDHPKSDEIRKIFVDGEVSR